MGPTIQIMVKYHYKCCSRDTTEEVETDEEDNIKQIIKQLPALFDDKISEESFKTTIPHNLKNDSLKYLIIF